MESTQPAPTPPVHNTARQQQPEQPLHPPQPLQPDGSSHHSYPTPLSSSSHWQPPPRPQPPLQPPCGLNPPPLGITAMPEPVTSVSTSAHLAPARQPRRYRTTRRVPLVKGNLVLDCPLPVQYLNSVPHRDEKEFTHMRYTAVTCDPSRFWDSYKLRQNLMSRHTELCICITMYNEDEVLLSRTLHGIMKNITHLCGRGRSRTWGPESWNKIVVCIIADGREKVHPRVFDLLSALGVYQEGVAKSIVNGRSVHAHLYEYTTQLSLNPDMEFRGAMDKIVPTQILFCVKEKNQRKINSHRWFFQAFCPLLQPHVCMLFDVGTRPGPTSIYRLWKTFDINADVGGACGEVRAMIGTAGVALLNPLVAAQNFEYKISNILDKPLESVLGYIQVLPGAFSAYRWRALVNDVNGRGPLQKYFLGEKLHGSDAGIFEANMYLAEDRILCFELVAKHDSKWLLHYVSGAYAITDVPNSVPELITQRRRWLNGSFFSGIYALFHWGRILSFTTHSGGRKFLLFIELIYLGLSWIFSWFALGNFFLSFYIITSSLSTMQNPPFSTDAANTVHIVLTYVYVVLLIVLFLLSMGNRPQGSKPAFTAIMLFFSLLMVYIIFASVWLVYDGVKKAMGSNSLLDDGSFRDIIVSMAATYALYLLASLLFLDPWHMITSSLQYILMTPSYINIFNTYAFCNTHDVSWGTKDIGIVAADLGIVQTEHGQATAEVALPEQKDVSILYEEACMNLRKREPQPKRHRDPKTKQEDYYRAFRTRLVITWIVTNLVLVAVITTAQNLGWLGDFDQRTNGYMAFLLWSVAALAVIRFIGALFYRLLSVFTG